MASEGTEKVARAKAPVARPSETTNEIALAFDAIIARLDIGIAGARQEMGLSLDDVADASMPIDDEAAERDIDAIIHRLDMGIGRVRTELDALRSGIRTHASAAV